MNEVIAFSQIEIYHKSIVICDIDDTVFDYGHEVENYWKSKIEDPHYFQWHDIITRTIPQITNKDFFSFLDRIYESNSEIHFVTHRNPLFKNVTISHFEIFNLCTEQIHFLSGSSKGKYVKDNFDITREIIFIDDSIANYYDMQTHIPKSKCYLFKK